VTPLRNTQKLAFHFQKRIIVVLLLDIVSCRDVMGRCNVSWSKQNATQKSLRDSVMSGMLRLSYPGDSDEVSQSRPASDLGQSPKSPLISLAFVSVTVAI
jgi:hypothetical protein